MMRDGWWGGKPHPMNSHGVPKGLRTVLEERGVNTRGILQEEMRSVLGSHPDFRDEKNTSYRRRGTLHTCCLSITVS